MTQSSAKNPTAAMLVIGDEILSGRTHDTNTHHLAGRLTQHGISLREARIVSDNTENIVSALNMLRKSYDHVFTSGGIGPTHDDITADAVAKAFGVPIGHRADAMKILSAYYKRIGGEFNSARQKMARIPKDAGLIDNPISAAPGFILENTYVMAGVPKIFAAMLEGVIPKIKGGLALLSDTLTLFCPEGEIAADLSEIAAHFPDLTIGSYPFQLIGKPGTNLVIRGTNASRMTEATEQLKKAFTPKMTYRAE